MSTIFILGNINFFQKDSHQVDEFVQQALREQPEDFNPTYTRPYIIQLPNQGRAVIEWIHVRRLLGTDAAQLTQAEIEGRSHVFKVVDFMKRRLPMFKDVELLSIAPQIGIREAVDRSKQLMDGNKGRLFCLQLSFIGWWLLSALTFGIVGLWIMPYMQTAQACFYLELTGRSVVGSTGNQW
jgi:hypothetical protein